MIEIRGNDLGYINTEDIQFKGGQKLGNLFFTL